MTFNELGPNDAWGQNCRKNVDGHTHKQTKIRFFFHKYRSVMQLVISKMSHSYVKYIFYEMSHDHNTGEK